VHPGGAVSRHELERYIESLQLNFPAAMTTQVVLALLDLDLGAESCDTARFARTLVTPPPTASFTKKLWANSIEESTSSFPRLLSGIAGEMRETESLPRLLNSIAQEMGESDVGISRRQAHIHVS